MIPGREETSITITPEEYSVASGLDEPVSIDTDDDNRKGYAERLEELTKEFERLDTAAGNVAIDYRYVQDRNPAEVMAAYLRLAKRLTDEAYFLGRVSSLGLLGVDEIGSTERLSRESTVRKEKAISDLTPRQSQILELIIQGQSNSEIADNLHIAEQTVKFHLSHIYAKLGVGNRTEATRKAIELGFAQTDQQEDSHIEVESAGLTRRELEIIRLVAQGLSNEAIAKELWIAEQTVKFHLTNIFPKLGVQNRTQAARLIIAEGISSEAENEQKTLSLSGNLASADTSLAAAVEQSQVAAATIRANELSEFSQKATDLAHRFGSMALASYILELEGRVSINLQVKDVLNCMSLGESVHKTAEQMDMSATDVMINRRMAKYAVRAASTIEAVTNGFQLGLLDKYPGGQPKINRPLSDDEKTILRLLSGGLSSPNIAEFLDISPRRLAGYLKTLRGAYNAQNNLHAVRIGLEIGDIPTLSAVGTPRQNHRFNVLTNDISHRLFRMIPGASRNAANQELLVRLASARRGGA